MDLVNVAMNQTDGRKTTTVSFPEMELELKVSLEFQQWMKPYGVFFSCYPSKSFEGARRKVLTSKVLKVLN